MAYVRETSRTNEKRNSSTVKKKEFIPNAGWTEDSKCHYLLLDLPGFKKDDVKLQVDASGQTATIRGENKISSFVKSFNIPEKSDIKKISAKFEAEIMYVTVPKQIIEEKKEVFTEKDTQTNKSNEEEIKHEKPNNTDENKIVDGLDKGKQWINDEVKDLYEKSKEKRGKQASTLGNMLKEFKKNKGFAITAFLAFSLGVLVTHAFESRGHHAAQHNSQELKKD